jgi:hypothetical protein
MMIIEFIANGFAAKKNDADHAKRDDGRPSFLPRQRHFILLTLRMNETVQTAQATANLARKKTGGGHVSGELRNVAAFTTVRSASRWGHAGCDAAEGSQIAVIGLEDMNYPQSSDQL